MILLTGQYSNKLKHMKQTKNIDFYLNSTLTVPMLVLDYQNFQIKEDKDYNVSIKFDYKAKGNLTMHLDNEVELQLIPEPNGYMIVGGLLCFIPLVLI